MICDSTLVRAISEPETDTMGGPIYANIMFKWTSLLYYTNSIDCWLSGLSVNPLSVQSNLVISVVYSVQCW